jgi:hypothetical protein
MALLFVDSFDHYDTLTLKWSANTTGIIDLSGTQARTGVGCCVCFPFGPELNVNNELGVVMGDAYKTQSLVNDIHGFISGTGVFRVRQVRVRANSDGSVSVLSGNDPGPVVLGTSAPNLLSVGVYAYIETKISAFSASANVTIRINGQTVLTLTGVNTNPDGTGHYNTMYLQGPGNGPSGFHDDIYLLNLVDSGVPGNPNNDFLGAVRNYAQVPIADASPLQWTPSTGVTHFNLVNAIPQQTATFVSDDNIGDVDQYVYGTTGVVPPVTVFGVQVCLLGALDAAGSRSVGANVGGVQGSGAPLTTSFNMVKNPYDGNPVNSKAWQLTDFGTVRFGPGITA